MKYQSAFDIIGPAMVGPSSSHTAGSLRLGRIARCLLAQEPISIDVLFYGSFATTYQGHGSDVAVVAGALGFETHDPRIVDALNIAKEQNVEVVIGTSNESVEHPNTMRIRLLDKVGHKAEIIGQSVGGGKVEVIQINGYQMRYSGADGIVVYHNDRYGMIERVARILTSYEVNIARMEVGRKRKNDEALMVIEIDGIFAEEWIDEIRGIPDIDRVIHLQT